MITPPPWYDWLETKLAPSWPAMILIAIMLASVTGLLIWRGKPVPLALWLTYLVMP